MSRDIPAVLGIMRLAIGRRNDLDPDSDDPTLLGYVNDFMSLTMSDEFKIFEQFGSFEFNIDETTTDGVYPFPSDAVNVVSQVMISLTAPVGSSVSWYNLNFYQDAGSFFAFWGINNEDILIRGAPTDVLYYGNELTFRSLPDDDYTIKLYGYTQQGDLEAGSTLPFDYWMRFLAYGAAKAYAADYRLDQEAVSNIERNYKRERKLLLTRTHNQVKTQRSLPRW